MVYLSDVGNKRENNWNIIRLVAAILVIISHSFPLCYGETEADALSKYTEGRLSIGGVAVAVFFLAGGFLLSGSLKRNSHAKRYFVGRILRILPQLMFVVLILTFIVGPLVSSFKPAKYFTDFGTYKFLLNGIMIPIHSLPGVFTNNPYPNVINGALWTLPVEFICYLFCFFFNKFPLSIYKKHAIMTTGMLVIVGVLSIVDGGDFIVSVIRPVLLFYVGMLLYDCGKRIKLTIMKGFLALTVAIVLIYLKLDVIAMVIFFPYFLLCVVYGTKRKINLPKIFGEPSYGMYLWGFTVQQVIVCYADCELKWYNNAMCAIAISLFLGIINYYVIDKQIGRIKLNRL